MSAYFYIMEMGCKNKTFKNTIFFWDKPCTSDTTDMLACCVICTRLSVASWPRGRSYAMLWRCGWGRYPIKYDTSWLARYWRSFRAPPVKLCRTQLGVMDTGQWCPHWPLRRCAYFASVTRHILQGLCSSPKEFIKHLAPSHYWPHPKCCHNISSLYTTKFLSP